MKTGKLTFTIFLLIIFNDLGDSLAQLLMKKGLLQTGIEVVTWRTMIEFLAHNASSPFIWAGIAVYALNFFLWIVILSHIDLSVAMPIGSMTYLMIPFLAIFFLKEQITFLRWIGIAFIVAGIYFVSKSTHPSLEKV